MAKRTEEQEQVISVSKVPRRELRKMLRRWRLLDLDEWEPLGGCVTLSAGTPGLRLYDEDFDADVRKDVEGRLTEAARLFAMELEVAEPLHIVSDGHWPITGSRDEATSIPAQLTALSGITRAFGGAIRVDSLTRDQLQQLMEELTRETAYARCDCSVILAILGSHVVWSPCHHGDIHVYTDGNQAVIARLRDVASALGLSISHGSL